MNIKRILLILTSIQPDKPTNIIPSGGKECYQLVKPCG